MGKHSEHSVLKTKKEKHFKKKGVVNLLKATKTLRRKKKALSKGLNK